jgi:hypothetical protein
METVTTEAKLTPKLLEELENIIQEGWYPTGARQSGMPCESSSWKDGSRKRRGIS